MIASFIDSIGEDQGPNLIIPGNQMINITKTFLPPLAEYQRKVQEIFERGWITNHGPLVNELEGSLKRYLGEEGMLMITNGTIALQIAIKALELKGDVITTPYSYAATTSSIVWENCRPIFVDISPSDFNIDVNLIEQAITPDTTAILATHVYGNACNIEQISGIAKKHNLRVIYDAAHAFGTRYNGRSIFSFGDVSITSFHATKLFHTVEGGAVFAGDPALLRKMSLLRNFGHTGTTSFEGIGTNGKCSELHAAMGLCNLKYIGEILERRKAQWLYYQEKLHTLDAKFLTINPDCSFNYAYFPVVFNTQSEMTKALVRLEKEEIFPRRYFSPALSTLDYVERKVCPVAERIADSVFCLPLFHDLKQEEQEKICSILLQTQS